MFNKTSLGFFKAAQRLTDGAKRSIWTGLDRKNYYPETTKEVLVVNKHGFESSTFRGKSFLAPNQNFLSFLLNANDHGVVYRGLRKEEVDDPLNKTFHSLIGRKPLVAYNDIKTVDRDLTQANLLKHQEGDIHGISTTMGVGTALDYSGYMSPSSLIMFIDTHNIPKDQQYVQVYNPEMNQLNTQGEGSNYRNERELTISGLHGSTVVGRAIRTGVCTLHFEFNPLYVDMTLLPPELKEEYKQLTDDFYSTIYDIRANPDERKINAFKVKQNEFYEKLIQRKLVDPVRRERILEDLQEDQSLTIKGPY